MRLHDWTQQDWQDELGSATVTPDSDVVAGASGTWRITFRVGRWGIDERGSIKLAWRQVSDWGPPQFDDPGGDNYTTFDLQSSHSARLEARYEWRGYIRHWRQALTIDVTDDALWPGDVITITLGETSGGSPGFKAQTFDESNFEFKLFVDPYGTGSFQPLPESPRLRVVGGPARRLVALVPSEVAVGESGWLLIKAEDQHGNPAAGYGEEVKIAVEGARMKVPASLRFTGEGMAVLRTEDVAFEEPGVARVLVSDSHGRQALSNPAVISGHLDGPRLHWGDFHGGQTGATVGVGTMDEFYRFARDVGALEFTTHQGNCFEVTAADMVELKEKTRAWNEPGRFVAFVGYEWSGTTPMGGDHALFFFDDDPPLHRCCHWLQTDFSDLSSDRDHITRIHDTLRGTRAISYPHVGGRPANLKFHDAELEPIIEVHSKHGMFEWMIEDAIEHGLRVGFAGGSDDHYGHPGACYPGPHLGHFAARNGLTALFAAELTRESVWAAATARRCYATSGERIVVRFTVDGHWMGEEIEITGSPRIEVSVHGTGPLERVEVFRGLDCIHCQDVAVPATDNRLRFLFAGARVRGRSRATRWDGSLDLTDGRVLQARPVALIDNRDRLSQTGDAGLQWTIATAGDARGFELQLDGDGGSLQVSTGPATFSVPVADVLRSAATVDAGGLGQRVEMGPAPATDGPWDVAFELEDTQAPPGAHAYWIRVTQVDQEKAWSSPVWCAASSP